MAISAFQQALNRLFKQFTLRMGREPQTPAEWMNIQNEAVRLFNKTKGDPQSMINQRYRDARGIGFNPKVIQGGKKEGIESLLKSGDVKVGVAPKTTAKTLADKKDRHILFRDAEEDIARIKRENKQAIEDFKKRHGKKTVEDFRDEGDYDPGGFAAGGIAKGAKWFLRSTSKNLEDLKAGHPRFNQISSGDKKILIEQYQLFINDLKAGKEVPVEALEAISKNPQYYKTKKVVRSQDPDLAEVEELIDEKVFGDVRQELKDFEVVGRKPQASGGLAYMLGEPTYMKMADGGDVPSPEEFLNDKHYNELRRLMDEYEQYKKNYDKEKQRRSGIQEVASGGKVGHGPWTTGQTPPGPQTQPEMPQPQVMGTPDPMKAPRLPSVAPRNMDPQYMQQQRMQQAMMQQGIPQGIPRVGMMYGGDPGFAFEYGGSWADWHDQHRNAMPIEDYIQTKLPKERLPFRENFSKGGMTRRAFLKMMGALSALPFIGKGVQKAAPKAIKEVTETIARDADGIPTYAFDLIEVVKAKGTKEIMEGLYKRNPPATKYTYKDVEVVEDGLGTTSVKKSQTKTGSWHDEATDDTLVDDYVDREVGFEIRKGEDIVKDEGLATQKVIRGADEYDESTAIMQGDPDGGMDVSEVLEEISDADHLDLKKIADEVKDIRTKKASGGLAYMLGE